MATNPASQTSPQRPGAAPDSSSTLMLMRRLLDELATLLRQELALATAELSRSISALRTGIASMAVGGAVLFAGFLSLLAAAEIGLTHLLPAWLATLLIGVAVAIIGVSLLLAGSHKLSPQALKPTRTQSSLRRDTEVFTRRSP